MKAVLWLLITVFFLATFVQAKEKEEEDISNTWAILIDTSAYWFNYRHASNVLGIYRQLKQRGIPDSRIILMLAEDVACNPRNVFPGTVVNNELNRENLVEGGIEVDYRGAEVSVENLIRLLTNRHDENVTKNKILSTNDQSRILIFMTGHGGENFLKFRNVEEVSAHDLSAAFWQMWQDRRYKEILFLIDTCQAGSMISSYKAPNIYGIASSKVGESSYSYTVDSEIGLSVIDRFSHLFYEYLKGATEETSLQEFINQLDHEFLGSTPVYRTEMFPRPADQIKIFDFISAKNIEILSIDSKNLQSPLYSAVKPLEETLSASKNERHTNINARSVYSITFDEKKPSLIVITSCLFIISGLMLIL